MATSLLVATVLHAAEPKWAVDQNGCKYEDPERAVLEHIPAKWSGACVDGYIDGNGKLESEAHSWRFEGVASKGTMQSGTVWYPNGSSFTGTIAKDQHEGTYSLPNGETLKGVFAANGKSVGRFEVAWPDGAHYEGEGSVDQGLNFRREGKGKQRYSDGATYEGDFKNDLLDGHGTFVDADGTITQGEFAGGKANGIGKETSPDGDVYEGEFKYWHFEGKGRLSYRSGSTYEGDFVANHRQGHGVFRGVEGNVYEGDWVGGALTGKCRVEVPKKTVFEGQCLNWKREGVGHLDNLVDGSVYDGEFKADLYDGHGRLTHDVYVYEGSFKRGVKEGTGKESYANGSYEGEFASDQWHGHGKLQVTNASGIVLRYDGSFVEGDFSGPGSLEIGSAHIDGEFKGSLVLGIFAKTRAGRSLVINPGTGGIAEVLPDGTTRLVDPAELSKVEDAQAGT